MFVVTTHRHSHITQDRQIFYVNIRVLDVFAITGDCTVNITAKRTIVHSEYQLAAAASPQTNSGLNNTHRSDDLDLTKLIGA